MAHVCAKMKTGIRAELGGDSVTGAMLGFGLWSAVGILFVALGAYAFWARKAVGFWANAEMFKVTDVKKYNRAVGKLFIAFGAVFILLGLPLLVRQNSPWILLSVLGVMIETITVMVIYTTVIESKYKKK